MRLGLVIYGPLDTRSGGFLYDSQVVAYLRQAGHPVDVISLPSRRYAASLLDNFSPALARRLAELEVDVLLQDELNHPSLFWRNPRLPRRYPIVSIVHHLRSSELRPAWQNRLYGSLERRYLRSVDGFIFNSRRTQAEVGRLAGQEAANRPAVVAYPAADHLGPGLTAAQVAQRLSQAGPLKLLFVGNLIPRKGLHVLLAALERLGNRNWQLSVVGDPQFDPAYVQSITRQAQTAGLSRQVRLFGRLDGAALQAQYRQSHVFVGPSSYEGFGIAYLEGLAHGLPVIAGSAGAAGEFIRPGVTGCLVPPEDPAALAEALRFFLEDSAALQRYSLAALAAYASHPTWAETGRKIEQFLAQM